jgi:NAD(P)-dependent dehydrogenase (short-subunit alcohol dehydrogenase family)
VPPIVLVTGSTDGIGLATARVLSAQGAHVVIHGRDPERLEAAARLLAQDGCAVVGRECADLSSRREVHDLAARVRARWPRLDVLVNNAGVFLPTLVTTVDGVEATYAVNHLAPFALAHLLLPALRASDGGRIVNVGSNAHRQARFDWRRPAGTARHDGHAAYAASKLALVLGTVEIARRLGDDRVTINVVHPGVVTTRLLKAGFDGDGEDSLADAAEALAHLALSADVRDSNGVYYDRLVPARTHPLASDPSVTAQHYAMSCDLAHVDPL